MYTMSKFVICKNFILRYTYLFYFKIKIIISYIYFLITVIYYLSNVSKCIKYPQINNKIKSPYQYQKNRPRYPSNKIIIIITTISNIKKL